MTSAASFEALLRRYGIGGSSPEANRLRRFLELLEKWNAAVNLTAATDWGALSPLVEEALWAAGLYPHGLLSHLDIGSGAGFPALLLKILKPRMRLRMLESRSRRAAFLETAAADLRLEGVTVICLRAEDYLEGGAETADVISWKGVRLATGTLERLLGICHRGTRFWLFHGAELPLRDPAGAGRLLRLVQREPFPARPGWRLSVFARA